MITYKRCDRSMPDYTLLPFPIFFTTNFFHWFRFLIPVQYIPRPYLFVSTASLPPIQKPYSLHQSPLVGGQNGIQVLGLWTFVVEEFGDNVPDYISSLDYCPEWFSLHLNRKEHTDAVIIPKWYAYIWKQHSHPIGIDKSILGSNWPCIQVRSWWSNAVLLSSSEADQMHSIRMYS